MSIFLMLSHEDLMVRLLSGAVEKHSIYHWEIASSNPSDASDIKIVHGGHTLSPLSITAALAIHGLV